MEESDLYKKYKSAYDFAYIKSFNEMYDSGKRVTVMTAHIVSNNIAQERARIRVSGMVSPHFNLAPIESKVEELMAHQAGITLDDLRCSEYSNTYTESVH